MHKSSLLALCGVAAIASSAAAQTTLNANTTANNGGAANWAIFFDLTAAGQGVRVTEMTSANTAAVGGAFTVEVFTRTGTGLGGPVSGGAGSSSAGWTSLGTAPATQGALASGISLPIDIPDIVVPAGQTVGVAVLFTVAGPRYFGTGTPPYQTFSDSNLTLTTGDARSAPFTATGSFFTSRGLTGSLTYVLDAPPACRPDLNNDGELTFDDISLFVSLYNANDPRADFNNDGEWTFDDISLFVQLYNAGC